MPPLFRWPGGKRLLVPRLLDHVPITFCEYFEPFLGAGALFFALRPRTSTLSDTNAELVNCFAQLRDRHEEVLVRLARLQKTESAYYLVRSSQPSDDIDRAVRLIFLTSLSFNGLYRVNLQGKFNVPYGHRPHLDICNVNRICSVSGALAGQTLMCCDFEEALRDATNGDLVYIDPPYTVAHGQNGFLKYNARIFSWEDQERLARVAHDLADRGCHVIISNAAHESIARLYRDFAITEVDRWSVISAASSRRRKIREYIIVNYASLR